MQKIPTIFVRDPKPKCTPVTEVPNPECEWVFNYIGTPYRKLDGINVKIEGGKPYTRIKPIGDYTEADYEPCSNKFVEQAYRGEPDGIYEAIGYGIRENKEKCEWPQLVRIWPKPDQLLRILDEPRRTYRAIMGYLATQNIEGIVYHHPDGRMAKIKATDFYHLKRQL